MPRLIAFIPFALFLALNVVAAPPALAEFARIDNSDAFRAAVEGKTLSRPLIRLQVSADGSITGTGATRPVRGNWRWENGYFCRDLVWGDRDLGYNCQKVAVEGGNIRFHSDRGTGDYADFRLK